MNLKGLYTLIIDQLNPKYGYNEARAMALILIEHYAGYSFTQIISHPEYVLTKPTLEQISKAVQQINLHVPIQYVLGHTEFFDLQLKVNPDVLIPRPETEELIRWIIADTPVNKPNLSILDIGTGSGCIALSLSRHFTNAKVYALDVSSAALDVAKHNAKNNNCSVQFYCASILEDLTIFNQQVFDIIVSNPPYVLVSEAQVMAQHVLDHEPHVALFVPDTDPLLFYKAISCFAEKHLEVNGKVYLEINEQFAVETVNLFDQNAYQTEIRKDIFDKDRMIKAIKMNTK